MLGPKLISWGTGYLAWSLCWVGVAVRCGGRWVITERNWPCRSCWRKCCEDGFLVFASWGVLDGGLFTVLCVRCVLVCIAWHCVVLLHSACVDVCKVRVMGPPGRSVWRWR
ncbi:hypothetical protein F5144DRAFT_574849 [Chaetomium tenue]|uniref:Uncharacterized protein n=1 Tax=Chaetomium tenue TaxID=1854479 RepID=A0ACB7PB16_9PEZI|nr:hypothetical protein F5144DRAFT_574849 [Chaetomium globosum]